MDGSDPYEGRVEIYYEGEWGTVCDNGWTFADARTVCRQLKLTSKRPTILRGAYFGSGNGTIWLNNSQCNDLDYKLAECEHAGWGNISDCDHRMDASVICSGRF